MFFLHLCGDLFLIYVIMLEVTHNHQLPFNKKDFQKLVCTVHVHGLLMCFSGWQRHGLLLGMFVCIAGGREDDVDG